MRFSSQDAHALLCAEGLRRSEHVKRADIYLAEGASSNQHWDVAVAAPHRFPAVMQQPGWAGGECLRPACQLHPKSQRSYDASLFYSSQQQLQHELHTSTTSPSGMQPDNRTPLQQLVCVR